MRIFIDFCPFLSLWALAFTGFWVIASRTQVYLIKCDTKTINTATAAYLDVETVRSWTVRTIAEVIATSIAVGSAIGDLQSGNVDLMGPLLKNEATEEMFEFPEHSYGTVYTTLNALTSGGLREQNLVNLDLLRVGLWEQAEVRNGEVLAFLESENLPYEVTYYDSAEAQNQALLRGEVDVISSVSLSPIPNTRIVAQFAPRPYYFAAPKGQTELAQELDATIDKLNQAEPKLQDTLYDKYFRNVEDSFVLTDEETAFLNQMNTLRVLCIDGDAPYAYRKDGEAAGML